MALTRVSRAEHGLHFRWLQGQEVILGVGNGDDRETKLTEHDRIFKDGGLSDFSERLFVFQAFDGSDADLGVFGVGGVDRQDFGRAYGSFADVGVIDHQLFAHLHATQVKQRLVVRDAVPDGFLVAEEVVEGVLVGLGF